MGSRTYYIPISETYAQAILEIVEPVAVAQLDELFLEMDQPDIEPLDLGEYADGVHYLLTGFALSGDPGPAGLIREVAGSIGQEGAGLLSSAGIGRLLGSVLDGLSARTPFIDPALTWAVRGHHRVRTEQTVLHVNTADDVTRIRRSLSRLEEATMRARFDTDRMRAVGVQPADRWTGEEHELDELMDSLTALREYYAITAEAVLVDRG